MYFISSDVSPKSWIIGLLSSWDILLIVFKDYSRPFVKTSCCITFKYLLVCVFMYRVQQAVRHLPQRKCPTWSSTSSQSSLTASRLPKVCKNNEWNTHHCTTYTFSDRRSSSQHTFYSEIPCSVMSQVRIELDLSPCLPTEINRSFQMSSFVETKALEQLTKCPVEFVEYPSQFYWSMWFALLNITHSVSI